MAGRGFGFFHLRICCASMNFNAFTVQCSVILARTIAPLLKFVIFTRAQARNKTFLARAQKFLEMSGSWDGAQGIADHM